MTLNPNPSQREWSRDLGFHKACEISRSVCVISTRAPTSRIIGENPSLASWHDFGKTFLIGEQAEEATLSKQGGSKCEVTSTFSSLVPTASPSAARATGLLRGIL